VEGKWGAEERGENGKGRGREEKGGEGREGKGDGPP